MQLLDNNEKETFMDSFPQIDQRYCEVLASRQVPHKEWHEHQKWMRYYLHSCNKYRRGPGTLMKIRVSYPVVSPADRPCQSSNISG